MMTKKIELLMFGEKISRIYYSYHTLHEPFMLYTFISDVFKLKHLINKHTRACENECNYGGYTDITEKLEYTIKGRVNYIIKTHAVIIELEFQRDPRGYTTRVKLIGNPKNKNSIGIDLDLTCLI